MVVCMESTDGPNQYTNRQNNAQYEFMLDEEVCVTFIISVFVIVWYNVIDIYCVVLYRDTGLLNRCCCIR